MVPAYNERKKAKKKYRTTTVKVVHQMNLYIYSTPVMMIALAATIEMQRAVERRHDVR